MKLLVDSGSTKADWISIDDAGKVLFTTQTLGLNPEVLDKEEIISRLNVKFDISHNKKQVSHLYFYGAGCSDKMRCDIIKRGLERVFKHAKVEVEHDLLASARAEGATIILSTHQIREAMELASRVALLDRGKLQYYGERTAEMLNDPAYLYRTYGSEA